MLWRVGKHDEEQCNDVVVVVVVVGVEMCPNRALASRRALHSVQFTYGASDM